MSKQATPNLIGLAGGPGAGKTTAADLLAMHHDFLSYAFADALRDFTYATDPAWRMAFDLVGYDEAKAKVEGFRERLIENGEAARNYISPNVWVDALEERIVPLINDGYSVVISDVRYPNEADLVRDWGGIVVGIDRPGTKLEGHAFPVMMSADEYILNDGTLVDLWDQLDSIVENLTNVRQ